jgi:formate hydrogenlyase subunit 4
LIAASVIFALFLSPFFMGLIVRTKAVWAGRQGAPLIQSYFDLWKLFRKGTVYGTTCGWPFRIGPIVMWICLVLALTLLPFGNYQALWSFEGDLIFVAVLLAAARYFLVVAALDTGSSFEGMGSGREVFFGALAEPGFFLILAVLAKISGSVSAQQVFNQDSFSNGYMTAAALLALALFLLTLIENSRIPADDPTTHLELTMIHEVMILDHSGPDLGWLEYAAALKLWIYAGLTTHIILPVLGFKPGWWSVLIVMLVIAVLIGTVESFMARLRLNRVPQLCVSVSLLALLAWILI